MPSVVVIGQGFAGLTTALVLSRNGYLVTVVGPQSDQLTASTAAHGVSTIKGLLESTQELFALKIYGHRMFLSWLSGVEADSGLVVAKVLGVHEPFWFKDDYWLNQKRIYKRRYLGAFSLEPSECHYFKRAFLTNLYPHDFWVDTDQYLLALKTACVRFGVKFEMEERVIGLVESGSGVIPEVEQGAGGTFDFAVICAGAGSLVVGSKLTKPLEGLYGLGGSTFICEAEGFKDGESFCAVRQFHAGTLHKNKIYLGSTTDTALIPISSRESETDVALNSARVSHLTVGAIASRLFNRMVIAEHTAANRWGLRVRTKNRTPFVKPVGVGGRVILNTGYYKSGVTLTPWGAQCVLASLNNHWSS
ncbi:MAG: FAD-dependent oxidoreductase [Proteobacteria bacterium]|nr:FAD-dependent oxidoreductase [Pseudomonadota bacterium]